MITQNGKPCEHITNFFLNLIYTCLIANPKAAEVKLIPVCGASNTKVTEGDLKHLYGKRKKFWENEAFFMKEGLPFARDLSLENSADSYLCFWLTLLNSVSYFYFLYQSPYLSLCTVFDSISSGIDEVLSINPPAVFVFGDFNVHHKDWLTYSGVTDQPGKLFHNFSI